MSEFDPWFSGEPRVTGARVLLFCLPHSGAGASAFRPWRRHLPAGVEIIPVHLPGREERDDEDPAVEPELLARALAARIDRPYAIYGHSIGARLGFEALRALRRFGVPDPVRFYAAASRAPQTPDSYSELLELNDQQLVEALIERYGAPAYIGEIPELRDAALPSMRSDMQWLREHPYIADAPLNTTLVALHGESDASVSPTDIAPWAELATAFTSVRMSGGHLFDIESASEVADFVSHDLLAALEDDSRQHLVGLVDGQWSLWKDLLIRSAGFPADGLLLLSAPECASTADAVLDGSGSAAQFAELFEISAGQSSTRLYELAQDPLLREALAWQNRAMIARLDSLVKAGPEPARTAKTRERQRVLTRYWQRYCGKAETVGFFGPVAWARVDAATDGVSVAPGPGLTRQRKIYFDHWPLEQLGRVLARDVEVRKQLAPALQPHLVVRGRRLVHPTQPPIELNTADAAVLSRCDGRRTAARIIDELLAEHTAGMRSSADVVLVLDGLVERGVLRWGFDVPVSLSAEDVLRRSIEALETAELRSRPAAQLSELTTARDAVAQCAGNAVASADALAKLEEAFRALADDEPTRRAGQAYAGRTVCVEETVRDLDAVVGTGLMKSIGAALAVPLTAARWFCGALFADYQAAIAELYEGLAEDLGQDEVPLGQLWFIAQPMFYGDQPRPCDRVGAQLAKLWAEAIGLESAQPGDRLIEISSTEVRTRMTQLFPDPEEIWSGAVIHSPDLLLAAESTQALAEGRFTAVLGELHTAWATMGTSCLLEGHPRPEALRAALRADLGSDRIDLLLPLNWPRRLPRLAFGLEDPGVAQLGFAAAPGADLDRLTPISAMRVTQRGAQLLAVSDDGRTWPLMEVFAKSLSEVSVDAFKLMDPRDHSPRIVIDRLVVARETWRTPVADCPVTAAAGEADEYLAARRWRRDLGLPEQVFVKFGTETKPLYVDLSSPAYTAMFAAMTRAAYREDPATFITVSEVLPGPGEHWLPDGLGRRYVSEFRMHVRDEHVHRLLRDTSH